MLSLSGGYQEAPVTGSSFRNFCWAPLGFYNPRRVSQFANGWNKTMIYTFYPLFKLDVTCIHKNVDDPNNSGE
jgi:hypothetical protein